MTIRWTRTESRLFDLLKDGEPHPASEMIPLVDDRAERINVQLHLSNMRKKLTPKGLLILCVYHNRKYQYRLVRRINTDE